jgi:ATP-binding cassette subfamily B protein
MRWFKQALKSRLGNFLALRRAVRLVWSSSPRWMLASLVLLILQGILPLVSIYMLKLILDAVTVALEMTDRDLAFQQVASVILLAAGVTLLSNFVRVLGGLVSQAQARRVGDYMFDVIHAKSIEVDLEFYENAALQDTLHRAQQEAAFRPLMIVNGLGQVIQNAISLIGTGWLLLAFNWLIGVILVIAVIPSVIVRLFHARRLYNLQRQFTPEDRRSRYFSWMLTGTEHAKEIRMFDLGGLFIQRFQALRGQLLQIKLKVDVQRAGMELIVQVIATAAIFGAYALIAYDTVMGLLTLGTLVLYYQAFQRGQGFLQDFLGSLASLYENNLFISNLYEFLDLSPRLKEPAHPQSVTRPLRAGISFKDVEFTYPGGSRPILKGVNLTIKPGEVVAVVGANGSGKTTLIKLLCRLYDPVAGQITLDGVDLRDLSQKGLRREISVIFQDYARYNLTAAENIGFGDASHQGNETAITAAARHSGADSFLSTLPKGYHTTLGRMFEQGEELSIGQWQKVALARAFLRDTQVIVLDEPTSAMDPKAEYEVFKTFRELLDGRTAILISHRLSTVKMADRIFVFDDGQIIESGSHDDLMKVDGAYADLFETQAQYYR